MFPLSLLVLMSERGDLQDRRLEQSANRPTGGSLEAFVRLLGRRETLCGYAPTLVLLLADLINSRIDLDGLLIVNLLFLGVDVSDQGDHILALAAFLRAPKVKDGRIQVPPALAALGKKIFHASNRWNGFRRFRMGIVHLYRSGHSLLTPATIHCPEIGSFVPARVSGPGNAPILRRSDLRA